MGTYRLIEGSHGRREGARQVVTDEQVTDKITRPVRRWEGGQLVVYIAGDPDRDVIELTPAEATALGARVVPITAPTKAETTASGEKTDADKDAEVWNTPAAEAIALIAAVETLDDLRIIERREVRNPRADGGRKTVMKAIADRADALTGT